jgi:carotenoid cleavage dioxygenase
MASLTELFGALGRPARRPARKALKNPYLEGNFAPVGRESAFEDLEVKRGRIPEGLRGTLYRMSPGPHYTPIDPMMYHWFDGDGVVDALRIDDGRVSHRNRWVRTEKFALEERAGRALFGGLRNLATGTPLDGWLALGFKPLELLELRAKAMLGLPPRKDQMLRVLRAVDTSNTAIVHMAGRLLSLVESSAAHELDPDTLETRGRFTFGGVVEGMRSMVAHPKIEPGTGTIYTFGYGFGVPQIMYYVFGADGSSRVVREIDVPFPAMMHDFSVTESRAVFYHLPATALRENLESGNPVRWEPSRGARIGVTLRDDPAAPVQWFDIPACYVFHPMNAFDDGGAVVLDVCRYARIPLFDPGGENPNAPFYEYSPAWLCRWRLDLATGKLSETILDDAPAEFPVVDPRYATRRYRHGWVAAQQGPSSARGYFNSIGYADLEAGTVRYRVLGPASYTSEPIFVPRSKDAPEGDGWLLAVVYHADEDASELWILDATDIDAEPVAVVRCRQRVPYGFHGTWVARP